MGACSGVQPFCDQVVAWYALIASRLTPTGVIFLARLRRQPRLLATRFQHLAQPAMRRILVKPRMPSLGQHDGRQRNRQGKRAQLQTQTADAQQRFLGYRQDLIGIWQRKHRRIEIRRNHRHPSLQSQRIERCIDRPAGNAAARHADMGKPRISLVPARMRSTARAKPQPERE